MSWQDWFYFSRNQRLAIVVLMCLLLPAMVAARWLIERNEAQSLRAATAHIDSISYPLPDNKAKMQRTERASSHKPNNDYPILPYYPRKYAAGTMIDLNAADTTQLKRVRGIGSYRARKIVEYREKLGGYTSVSQLKEASNNMPDSILRSFRINTPPRKTLRINTLDYQALYAHPYLNYEQTVCILEHRRKHDRVASLDELRMYDEFTEADLARLEPYITFE